MKRELVITSSAGDSLVATLSVFPRSTSATVWFMLLKLIFFYPFSPLSVMSTPLANAELPEKT
jgi:hypothetical protein